MESFYNRPLVARISQIFGDPSPPARVTEEQFDQWQGELATLAAKPWHEIDESDCWYYLLDLAYVDLQQDLFDYLFPGFLIKWWEGQLSRLGGPEAETNIYYAIEQGEVLSKMMEEPRRTQVLEWIADAYMDGVDAWSGQVSVVYNSRGPSDLHGPLASFNALGQSVPVTEHILDQLCKISSEGRAQWWLVFATGLVWNPNQCPAIPAWTPSGGGGGVYVMDSDASIHRHGFLPANLNAMAKRLDASLVLQMLERSAKMLQTTTHGDWARTTLEAVQRDPAHLTRRLNRYVQLLGLPDLGGSPLNPFDSVD